MRASGFLACIASVFLFQPPTITANVNLDSMSQEDILELGDSSLSSNDIAKALDYYQKGITQINEEEDSISTAISLYTNAGTSYSALGDEIKAIGMYKQAILFYSRNIEEIAEESMQKVASGITAQAAFFLGMSHEELNNYRKAADSYAFASTLDEYHWAALANLGAILQDHLKEFTEALAVYNKAHDILTQRDVEPTDPPDELSLVLSQLQYRIGLAITMGSGENQKCAMHDDPSREVPCAEMAANAFNNAVDLDPDNEYAKHMLASITADASFERASNTYVTQLFEDYAENFEHSLVKELGYNGFERLRRAFDVAFENQASTPTFDVVVDAGCGTGLVGEQFRNVTKYLIGVDLSPSIIEEAKKARPELYDETVVDDVTKVFHDKKPISMIVAADSYIYFGDLVPLFESMEAGLMDGGIATFTLENAPDEYMTSLNENKPDWRWQLQPSGRFAHNKRYVEDVGKQHSLNVLHYEAMRGFRHEGGKDVNGHIFIMQKKAAASSLSSPDDEL